MRLSLALVTLFLACTPKQADDDLRVDRPEPAAAEDEPRPWKKSEPTDKLSDKLTPADVRGCQTDADCVVSCRRDGDCCGDLCTCGQVYNQGFLEELERFQKAACENPQCPKAKCKPPREVSAVCVQGLCELKEG